MSQNIKYPYTTPSMNGKNNPLTPTRPGKNQCPYKR